MSELKDCYVESWEASGDMSREDAEARYERLHAAEIRKAKAEAWRELSVRLAFFEGLRLDEYPNPYREEGSHD